MGNYSFGESSLRARKVHRCDFCMNYIEVGQRYSRRIWVPQRGSFYVIREHESPGCPPNDFEDEMLHELERERAELGVPIHIEARLESVVVIDTSGKTRIEQQTVFVPVVGYVQVPLSDDSDEDIPF